MRRLMLSVVAAALVVALGAGAGSTATAGPPTTAQIRAALQLVYAQYNVQHPGDLVGSCAGAIDGAAHGIYCTGTARFGQKLRPDRHTLFQIGSITKTFTATLLALRVQQGSLSLSDRVRKFVPADDGRAQIPKAMTLLDLADHYSGLPRSPMPVDPVTSVDQLYKDVAQCEQTPGCPAHAPGQKFLYSNFAFGVLGNVLAQHDGVQAPSTYSAWEADTFKEITQPLGIPSAKTWFGWQATNPSYFAAHRAFGTIGNPPHEPIPPYLPNEPYSDGAGALYSSSIGMLDWLSYSMGLPGTGTPDLNAARHLLYDDPSHQRNRGGPGHKIGLAWNVDVDAGITCVSKAGSTMGFSSHIIFIDGANRGVFILLNNRPQHTKPATLAAKMLNALPPATSGKVPTCAVPNDEG